MWRGKGKTFLKSQANWALICQEYVSYSYYSCFTIFPASMKVPYQLQNLILVCLTIWQKYLVYLIGLICDLLSNYFVREEQKGNPVFFFITNCLPHILCVLTSFEFIYFKSKTPNHVLHTYYCLSVNQIKHSMYFRRMPWIHLRRLLDLVPVFAFWFVVN